MKSSIRNFLLVYLLLAITVTTTLTALGNYYLDQKDIQEHLDTLMAVSALSYQALLGDDLSERQLERIQETLDSIPRKIETVYQQPHFDAQPPEYFLEKFNFQVWDGGGRLLLHSADALQLPLVSTADGFSDKTVHRQKWRVFTAPALQSGLRTMLAERYDTRNDLAQRIALDDIYIMLLIFPLSGLLIWIIIGRGLGSLERVTREVAHRAPTHLEPVNIQAVPQEIKPLVDELNKLFNRLKEGFEREKRFAADAAHELRTPLAALKAQAQVALNSTNIDEKNQALQKLIASVNRSTHIVQQLLLMSKLLSDKPGIHDFDPMNLAVVTREILAMLAPTAIEKHVELTFEAAKKLPSIQGNTTAMSILVRNLVDNAIRYCGENGIVDVRVYSDEQHVILEVRDNGPGIPDNMRARVFERFVRVLGNKSPGSGLGLAIVDQICTLHQGTATLCTPPDGVGLMVIVSFPIARNFKLQ